MPPFPLAEADRTAGGIQSQGNLWIGTMIVRDGVVLHASPNQLAAFGADTGEAALEPAEEVHRPPLVRVEGRVRDRRPGLDLERRARRRRSSTSAASSKQRDALARDRQRLRPADRRAEEGGAAGHIFKTHHHHRCYRNKATSRYILASRRGTEFVDLEEGKHTVHNWVRGTCHVGMMPANGLQYAPPHPCQCYIDEKLNGMNALAPARDEAARERGADAEPSAAPAARARITAKTDSVRHPLMLQPSEDWPAFRHDSMRTGSVDTRVPDDAGAAVAREGRPARCRRRSSSATGSSSSLVDEHTWSASTRATAASCGSSPRGRGSIRRRPTTRARSCSARPTAGSTACGPPTGSWPGDSAQRPRSG